IYDGKFNTDPLNDINGLKRIYSLFGFLSRPPKNVLMIGLSTGSWAQVVANYPGVENLTIVEINPGYLQLIPEHPEVSSLLRNPKVHIVIDDGHRWLLRNPNSKFDLAVMNTTFFWRSNATNLLSREFLELVRTHLEPGGAHMFNTTLSPTVQHTAVAVYPYAVRIGSCIAVSDAPLRFHEQRWREEMTAMRIDGKPVIDLSRASDREYLESVVAAAQNPIDHPEHSSGFFEYETSLRQRLAGYPVITDDNMAAEWRGIDPNHLEN